MESRDILLVGLWTFSIISLVGALLSLMDGLATLMFFIVAVVVSLGVVAMPKGTGSPGGTD